MTPLADLVLGEVRREMQRARDEHGPLSTDPLRALRVLVEEVGEVADAIPREKGGSEEHLALELRQVAATALIWLENLESIKDKFAHGSPIKFTRKHPKEKEKTT